VLFGFSTEAERSLFLLLLSVSGVGTNTARLLLSGMNVDELKSAIIQEDVNTFSKVKGIGPKTAKRIIVELKDKVMKESGDLNSVIISSTKDNTLREEALSALVALGFNRIAVQKTVNAIMKENNTSLSVEELIKKSLRLLS
jgi:Holliday junction DNA helicase RuvA